MPTLESKLLINSDMPQAKIPLFQYDSMFRTKEIIASDRARFARAWHSYFGEWGDRGGASEEEAFNAWFEMIKNRYKLHTNRINIDRHPKFIKEKLINLDHKQFGFDAFGLKDTTNRKFSNYLRGYKNRYID